MRTASTQSRNGPRQQPAQIQRAPQRGATAPPGPYLRQRACAAWRTTPAPATRRGPAGGRQWPPPASSQPDAGKQAGRAGARGLGTEEFAQRKEGVRCMHGRPYACVLPLQPPTMLAFFPGRKRRLPFFAFTTSAWWVGRVGGGMWRGGMWRRGEGWVYKTTGVRGQQAGMQRQLKRSTHPSCTPENSHRSGSRRLHRQGRQRVGRCVLIPQQCLRALELERRHLDGRQLRRGTLLGRGGQLGGGAAAGDGGVGGWARAHVDSAGLQAYMHTRPPLCRSRPAWQEGRNQSNACCSGHPTTPHLAAEAIDAASGLSSSRPEEVAAALAVRAAAWPAASRRAARRGSAEVSRICCIHPSPTSTSTRSSSLEFGEAGESAESGGSENLLQPEVIHHPATYTHAGLSRPLCLQHANRCQSSCPCLQRSLPASALPSAPPPPPPPRAAAPGPRPRGEGARVGAAAGGPGPSQSG